MYTGMIPLCLLALLVLLGTGHAAPTSRWGTSYAKGSSVVTLASTLSSIDSLATIPWSEADWCHQSDAVEKTVIGVGPHMFREKMFQTLYNFTIADDKECVPLCRKTLSEVEIQRLSTFIRGKYRMNFYVDGLPVIDSNEVTAGIWRRRLGVPVGIPPTKASDNQPVVYNHLMFTILYHVTKDAKVVDFDAYRVVGVNVEASSRTTGENPCEVNAQMGEQHLDNEPISFSYGVKWVESAIPWKHRWKRYTDFTATERRVHWMAALNFVSIIVIESLIIWGILIRSLRQDLFYYNDTEDVDEDLVSGWKLIHGDVFRRPRWAGLLSLTVGFGAQMACTGMSLLLLGCIGIAVPQYRGRMSTAFFYLFCTFGCVNGLVTATLLKHFKMRSWKHIGVAWALFPAQIFGIFILLNLLHLWNMSQSAAPLSRFIVFVLQWVFISAPSTVIGAVAGFALTIPIPTRINNIPRTIPPKPWYMRHAIPLVLPSFITFVATYVELNYIYGSVWRGTTYIRFGFISTVYVFHVILSVQTSICMTYMRLLTLDYHWWWSSFVVSASYGVWLLLSVFGYYIFATNIRTITASALYFGYMCLATYVWSIMLGSLGLLGSFLFVRSIYGRVKVA